MTCLWHTVQHSNDHLAEAGIAEPWNDSFSVYIFYFWEAITDLSIDRDRILNSRERAYSSLQHVVYTVRYAIEPCILRLFVCAQCHVDGSLSACATLKQAWFNVCCCAGGHVISDGNTGLCHHCGFCLRPKVPPQDGYGAGVPGEKEGAHRASRQGHQLLLPALLSIRLYGRRRRRAGRVPPASSPPHGATHVRRIHHLHAVLLWA